METIKKIKKIISNVLSIGESRVKEDSKMQDFHEWDSFNHLMLINEIEKEFQIELKSSQVNQVTSFQEIKYAIEKAKENEIL